MGSKQGKQQKDLYQQTPYMYAHSNPQASYYTSMPQTMQQIPCMQTQPMALASPLPVYQYQYQYPSHFKQQATLPNKQLQPIPSAHVQTNQIYVPQANSVDGSLGLSHSSSTIPSVSSQGNRTYAAYPPMPTH